MSGGGSSGSRTQYEQSPEQRQLYRMSLPVIEQMLRSLGINRQSVRGGPDTWSFGGPQTPLWNVPEMPQYGAMPNVPAPVLPTSGWKKGIAPEVMAGVKEPFMEGQRQLQEALGGGGIAGSASAGRSGAGASGLADFWAKASPQIGMQAWGMVAPEQMRFGQQQYQQAMGGREQQYMRALQGRQDLMSAYQAPYQFLPAMMGGMSPTFSQGITTQPQNWWERYAMPSLGALGPAAMLGAFM